ncbi:carboxymuconolactone decarboxylase family protein [Luteibacter pinisoli]|uniref:Carboxymuconolactone decarboxylase family protein n=1 Tax=Luteibacter pinisoli TaxID=2589080 RepID=A0A4Y5YZT7_9GAMM|nr:carboxymuconolactone decarboxylase family protein [Luteibacter pinisoli]QDE37723.1 carboxymuconolactone decarboxylase family protein [Luteibacter pinisoli]
MNTFTVPSRDDVSPANQALFDKLQKTIGSVPNLYATLGYSEHGLGTYLALNGARTTIAGKAREIVNLVVSQVNECDYCLAAHTAIGKMSGLTEAQIMEARRGRATFDAKLDALAVFTRSLVENRGKVDSEALDAFFSAGWTKENMVDVIVAVGDKTITNYLHSVTKIPVDFPAAPALTA